MDFMSRDTGAPQQMHAPNPNQPVHQPRPSRKSKGLDALKGLRLASVALLFSITVILVALIWIFVLGAPKNESNYVDKDKMQAVFLNGGQVYFGKVKDLNDKYIRMTDIFYLRVNQVVQPNQESNDQASQNNNISLVKLGCELHRPDNEMLINREHVIFWENLKQEDGENTVPGAVKKYLAQFPNGQECQAAAGNNSGSNTTTPTNNTGNTNTNSGGGLDTSTNQ